MARGTADWSRKRPLIRYTTGDDVDELAYRINEHIDEIRDHITSTTAEIRNAVINTAQATRDAIVDVAQDTINRLAYYNRLIPTGMLVFQAVGEHIPQMLVYLSTGSGVGWYLLFERYLFGNATVWMYGGIPGGVNNYFYRHFAASLQGRISGEVDVVNVAWPMDAGIWVTYTKNGRDRRFYLRYISNVGTVYIQTYPTTWVTVATGVTIRSDWVLCYPLKVVGDPSTNRYVRVHVADKVFDVSSYEAADYGSTSYDDYGIYIGHETWSTAGGAMVANSVSFCHKEE